MLRKGFIMQSQGGGVRGGVDTSKAGKVKDIREGYV